MSAKDILSQAAAKGLLLDSILGKSKEEEKQGKEAQHGSDATHTRREPKTAAVPHPEAVSNRKAAVAVSKVESKRKKKNSDQPRGHIQLKKPTINPASDTGVSKVPKHTSVVKVHRKQTQARKPRAECKKMVKPRAECKKLVAVKLVEIVFPPMISPYGHPQGNQHRMPAHISLLQSRQRNRSLRDREPPPPVSKVVKPTVLRNSQSGL